ncbi:hypothetical protein GBAR_LOCUS13584, partial [Geodia barretti]
MRWRDKGRNSVQMNYLLKTVSYQQPQNPYKTSNFTHTFCFLPSNTTYLLCIVVFPEKHHVMEHVVKLVCLVPSRSEKHHVMEHVVKLSLVAVPHAW